MNRDRFYLLLNFFHFNDNHDPDYYQNDKIHLFRLDTE